MKKTVLIIVVILVILLIGGYFIFSYYGKGREKTNQPSGNSQPQARYQEEPSPSPQAILGQEISIKNFSFSPSVVTIKKGTTITWTNEDSVGHTVTSDSGKGDLNSALINKGEKYSFKFNNSGEYTYHCSPHPTMKAKIIVE